MIKYPITQRDLLKLPMMTIPAAEVKFNNPVLAQFQEDSDRGLCTMEIVKGPEVKTNETVYDANGVGRAFIATRQTYFVAVFYHDPELEMLRKLAI